MRFDSDTIVEVQDALMRNRSRTLLTGFGVFWGIFMLLFLLGGGQGLKSMLSKNFEGFATNTNIIVTGTTTKPWKGMSRDRKWDFTTNDVERLKLMVPELDVVTPIISSWGQQAVCGIHTFTSNIKGVAPDYSCIETPQLRYGRYINQVDIRMERKVCVIGKRVYTTLFPEGGDPCGKLIKVGPVWYAVVGVDYNSGNVSINGRADETVTIPFSVAQKVYHRGNNVDIICMTGRQGVSMSSLEGRLRQIVSRQHLFDPSDEQALMIINMEQEYAMVNNLFVGLNFLIILIGLGTLLAGIIGVSNIMMVGVKSRTIEIGIRRAIGATPADILSQIMMESVMLTAVAGTLGILFSVAMLSLMEKITGEPSFQIGFWLAVGTLALLVMLGVAAGFAPATRAMAIRPVEAMRDE